VPSHYSQYPNPSRARAISRPQARRDRRLPVLVAAAGVTFALALRPDVAANIPWQSVVGTALLFGVVGGAVASAMGVGDLYADTLSRSSWPGHHENE
jgi:hypothetical protein